MSKKSSYENSSSSMNNGDDNSSPFIRFRLISGRNLVSRDINGFSDPFVVIKIEGGRVQSGKQKKTLNPEWNEILDLVPDWSRFPTTIKMVCWDWDRFGRDFMGEVKISMKSLFNEDGTPILWRADSEPGEGVWYPLEARLPNDNITGDIQFEMGIVASSEKHLEILNQYYYSLSQASKLTASNNSELDLSNRGSSDSFDKENGGLVFLDIVSASDLPYDKAAVGNSFDMDPFAVVTLGKTTFKTSTIRHDRSPVWNERMIFKVTADMLSYNVKFSIYDYDKFSNNDFIGSQTTPLHLLLANCAVDDTDPDLLHQVQHLNINKPASYNASMEPVNSPGLSNIKPKEYIEPTATTFALGLELAKKEWQDKFQSKLTIKASFLPYATIRKNFWYAMTKSYDTDGNGHMNLDEITTMLESLESTVCEDTVRGFFQRYNKSPLNDELTFTELVACLEELMNKSKVGGSRPSSPNLERSSEQVVTVKNCPICQTQFHSKSDSDLDIVSHISLCYSADPSRIDRIIMGNMVTEAHAQRKWFTKIATYVGYGSYETGVDNANILVQDRKSGEILEEKMPVYIRMGIRLLYRTGKSATTSHVKKILKNMSIKQGEKYTDILSKREIAPFIRFHKLKTEEILEPLDSFQNFNEFFYRKLKPEFRKLQSEDPKVAVSPADSRVMAFHTIDIAKDLWIKGENFSVQNLVKTAVKDPQVIESLNGGSLAIFRLAPQDYHRFHIPVDGIIGEPHKIEGEYYTVNPMAIRSTLDVYGNNTRVISVINSPEFGNVVVCCIGAMMVGSIVLTSTPNQPVERLQEHGYFAFGGSTIVLLFEKGKIIFDKDLIENSKNKLETLLAVGNQIGVRP